MHFIISQGEKTAEIICKYLTIDAEPNDMRQVFKKIIICVLFN